jgi:hypothetical protein
MPFYCFSIINNAIDKVEKEPAGKSIEYTYYESLETEQIYYRIINGKITHVICEANDLQSAKKATIQFLLTL